MHTEETTLHIVPVVNPTAEAIKTVPVLTHPDMVETIPSMWTIARQPTRILPRYQPILANTPELEGTIHPRPYQDVSTLPTRLLRAVHWKRPSRSVQPDTQEVIYIPTGNFSTRPAIPPGTASETDYQINQPKEPQIPSLEDFSDQITFLSVSSASKSRRDRIYAEFYNKIGQSWLCITPIIIESIAHFAFLDPYEYLQITSPRLNQTGERYAIHLKEKYPHSGFNEGSMSMHTTDPKIIYFAPNIHFQDDIGEISNPQDPSQKITITRRHEVYFLPTREAAEEMCQRFETGNRVPVMYMDSQGKAYNPKEQIKTEQLDREQLEFV